MRSHHNVSCFEQRNNTQSYTYSILATNYTREDGQTITSPNYTELILLRDSYKIWMHNGEVNTKRNNYTNKYFTSL